MYYTINSLSHMYVSTEIHADLFMQLSGSTPVSPLAASCAGSLQDYYYYFFFLHLFN